MIEFTLSRVVLCVCGVTLLMASMSTMDLVDEENEGEMDADLAESVADILDRFQQSSAETLTLRGTEIVPDEHHTVLVRDHVVTVTRDGHESKAYTEYGGSLEITIHTEVTLMRSITEGLDDGTYGGDEGVDLRDIVVQVGGCTGAALDTMGHVERMGAMHT